MKPVNEANLPAFLTGNLTNELMSYRVVVILGCVGGDVKLVNQFLHDLVCQISYSLLMLGICTKVYIFKLVFVSLNRP